MLAGLGAAALFVLGVAALAAGLERLGRYLEPRLAGAGRLGARLAAGSWAGLLALLVPLGLGVGEEPTAEAPPAAPAPPLVLLTLDTLRADHVGAIGGARTKVETPRLDALAGEGALFTRGVSPVPLTLPAHAAMLTGRHPLEFGVLRNGQALAPEIQTVAERLHAAGWRTGAFVSSAILRADAGLGAGFATYDDRFDALDRLSELGLLRPPLRTLDLVPVERRGELAVARALAWLARPTDRPSFLWVHLYEPHAPYDPPSPWDRHYPADAPDAQGNPDEMRAARALIREEREVFAPFVPPDLRRAVARYAGEISWTDALAGRLLEALPPETRVIVASDHGESLTEHGALLCHGSQVFDTTTRVPIWLRAAGLVPAGARVEAPVPLEAVGPTLLGLGGLEPGGPTLIDGIAGPWPSLPLISVAGTQQSRDELLLKEGWEIGAREIDFKWISRRDGALERYVLELDPGELSDTAPEAGPEERARVEALMTAVRTRLEAVPTNEDPERTEELRALGYVD